MNKVPAVRSVEPEFAIPGGELMVSIESPVAEPSIMTCLFDGVPGEITAASSNRLLVKVPEGDFDDEVAVYIDLEGQPGDSCQIKVGRFLGGNMHIVANPAIDPSDGSIVTTRSGSRGQELPATIFRFKNGDFEEIGGKVLNPTGVAFDSSGKLFVTNRAAGLVLQVNEFGDALPVYDNLGVATGIAFDSDGTMYVGDRGGRIFKVPELESVSEWADLEPSVSAFHMAFGPDGSLFVSAPGLCSYDGIYRIRPDASVDLFYRGLGRPQGLAFDTEGRLYAAACIKSRHGIVRISPDGVSASLWLAGMNVIGLCFDDEGGLIVATSDSLYRVNAGIDGALLT